MDRPADITRFLRAWGGGDAAALNQLIPLVYDQLRRIAAQQNRKEQAGHPLQTTALIHEAYLRLVKIGELDWQDRSHFFAVAAKIMRRVLVDAARRQTRVKRGGEAIRSLQASPFDLDQIPAADAQRCEEFAALDDALAALTRMDPRRAQVVEMRFFGGFSVEETATALGVSPQTVMRDWKLARAWLSREMAATG